MDKSLMLVVKSQGTHINIKDNYMKIYEKVEKNFCDVFCPCSTLSGFLKTVLKYKNLYIIIKDNKMIYFWYKEYGANKICF